jgi:membrane protease YdiL (CAAX protease family)
MVDRKGLIQFLAIAFPLAWVLFLLPIAAGPVGSSDRQMATSIAWPLAMWAPGIAAIVAARATGRGTGSLGLRRLGDRRAYLWAWLLPPVLAVATGLLTIGLGAGWLDLELTRLREVLAAAPGGEAIPPVTIALTQVVFAITLAPFINVPFALGEELGWRGWLLPQLLPLGQLRAIAVSSAIWGIWHAPAILQGHNYPTQPVLGIFLMVVFCLLAGTFLSWLYLRTSSSWAPALGHGAINATAALPLLVVADVDLTVGGTLASVIGWVPLGVFVAWLLLSHRLPTSFQLEQEAIDDSLVREKNAA